MGSWHVGMAWTPALALRLADILTAHGAGHLRPVLTLRKAAVARSPALGQRAEQAYQTAAQELRDAPDWPECRSAVARILAEAGCAGGGEDIPEGADWVQATVMARALELGLTAYAIAQRTGGAVSEDHIQAYLTRRKSCGSHKLQHIFRALGLRLTADAPSP
jgi:hypothetical protein